MRKFLFIYTDFLIGGIQTQILEQCKCFHQQGEKPKLLLLTRNFDKALLNQVKDVAEVKFLDEIVYFKNLQRNIGDRGVLFSFLFPLNKKITDEFFYDIKYCHVSNLIGLLFTTILLQKGYLNNTIVSLGVYHSGEVILYKKESSFIRNLLDHLVEFPSENVIATGAVTQEALRELYQLPCSSSIKLLKMGVPLHNKFISKTRGEIFKVISIGRLVNFKTYNLLFLEVIKELVNCGYNIKFTVIGDGPLHVEISNKVIELNIEKYVELVGSIEYGEIDAAIDSADCFIGSGTTLILSSGRSCPSIIGIDSNKKTTSYGFLQNTQGQLIQEFGLNYPEKNIKKIVESLMKCDDKEYENIRLESFVKAQEFSLSKSNELFLEFHNEMLPLTLIRKRKIIKLYLSLVYSVVRRFFLKEKVAKDYK